MIGSSGPAGAASGSKSYYKYGDMILPEIPYYSLSGYSLVVSGGGFSSASVHCFLSKYPMGVSGSLLVCGVSPIPDDATYYSFCLYYSDGSLVSPDDLLSDSFVYTDVYWKLASEGNLKDGFIFLIEDGAPVWADYDILGFVSASDPVFVSGDPLPDPTPTPDPTPEPTPTPEPVPVPGLHYVDGVVYSTSAFFVVQILNPVSGFELQAVITDVSTGEVMLSEIADLTPAYTLGRATYGNLQPETDYQLTVSVLQDGAATDSVITQPFTTLAGESVSDQLGSIQGSIESVGEDIQGSIEDVGANIQGSIDDVGNTVDDIQGTQEEILEEVKESLPQKIIGGLIDGIVGLFVPSAEDLEGIQEDYEDMLSEKLGFVWQAYELLSSFVGGLEDNLTGGQSYTFTFPEIAVPMNGETHVLVEESEVDLDNGFMDVVRPVLGTIVTVICVLSFVNMAHDYVLAIISGVSAWQFEKGRAV